jgi:hypothetical protein
MNTSQKNALLKRCTQACKEYGVQLYISKGRYVKVPNEDMKSNGYFDDQSKRLAVASKTPNFELILAHEYNHMLQWINNTSAWINYTETEVDDIDATQMVEWECECMTYSLLQELGLSPKEVSIYAQKANAYVLYYSRIKKTNEWYTIGMEPYNIKEIYCHFPDTMISNKFFKDYKKYKQYYDLLDRMIAEREK